MNLDSRKKELAILKEKLMNATDKDEVRKLESEIKLIKNEISSLTKYSLSNQYNFIIESTLDSNG